MRSLVLAVAVLAAGVDFLNIDTIVHFTGEEQK